MRPVVLLLLAALLGASVAAAQQPAPQGPPAVAPEVLERARAALSASDFETAVVQFSLFILLNPTSAQGYYFRAVSYDALENPARALDDLGHAITFSAGQAQVQSAVYATRGELHARLNRPEDALQDYDEAVDLAPSADNLMGRALLLVRETRFAEAVSDLDEAIRLSAEEQPVLYFYRAAAKRGLDDAVGAAQDYLRWIESVQQRALDAAPLAAGQSVTLDMGPGIVHRIPFAASAGERISVIAAGVSGDIDPLIVLLDEDGTPLAGSDDLPNGDISAAIDDFALERDGTYVVVLGHSISGYTGRVLVLLDVAPE